jgi:hypothetical protein
MVGFLLSDHHPCLWKYLQLLARFQVSKSWISYVIRLLVEIFKSSVAFVQIPEVLLRLLTEEEREIFIVFISSAFLTLIVDGQCGLTDLRKCLLSLPLRWIVWLIKPWQIKMFSWRVFSLRYEKSLVLYFINSCLCVGYCLILLGFVGQRAYEQVIWCNLPILFWIKNFKAIGAICSGPMIWSGMLCVSRNLCKRWHGLMLTWNLEGVVLITTASAVDLSSISDWSTYFC